MDIFELVNRLSDVGLVTLLILVLWGGWKRVWVWGHQLDDERASLRAQLQDERAEKEEWKTIAQRLLPVADRAVRQLEQAGAPGSSP